MRIERLPATVVVMARHLEITVDVELDATPICGLVLAGTQPARPFSGWLELASAIEQLRSAASPTDQTRAKDRLIDSDLREERPPHTSQGVRDGQR